MKLFGRFSDSIEKILNNSPLLVDIATTIESLASQLKLMKEMQNALIKQGNIQHIAIQNLYDRQNMMLQQMTRDPVAELPNINGKEKPTKSN